MRRAACVVVVVTGLNICLAGASARAESPATQAIAILKHAKVVEQSALHQLEQTRYKPAFASTTESETLLDEAAGVVKAGIAAGSLGPGIKPTAGRAALDAIDDADSLDTDSEQFTDAARNIAAGGPYRGDYVGKVHRKPGSTNQEWEEQISEVAQSDIERAIEAKQRAIDALQPRTTTPAPAASGSGSCSNFTAIGHPEGQTGQSHVKFDCTIAKTTVTSSALPEIIITLDLVGVGHPILWSGGLASHSSCDGGGFASPTTKVTCVVQNGSALAGTHAFGLDWDLVTGTSTQGTQLGSTCGAEVLVTVQLAETSAQNGAAVVVPPKKIASKSLTAAC